MQLLKTQRRPVLFTAEQYMKLHIEGRTELLGGVIYHVSPKNEPHRYAVEALNRALTHGLFGSEYAVRIQDDVAVPEWQGHDAPEIDVAVLKRAYYLPGPTARDAFAFIEVSDVDPRTARCKRPALIYGKNRATSPGRCGA